MRRKNAAGDRPAGQGDVKAYTYLLACADGTLYCGWTTDPEKRLEAHNAGTGSKYTLSRRPVRMVYVEAFGTRQEAMSREVRIKRMTRQEKLRLTAGAGSTETEDGTNE